MKNRNNKLLSILAFIAVILFSCEDLEELNVNPNGVEPSAAHPNLLMPTIISSTAQRVVDLGFGDIAGVMQHTQKDGWSGGHNSYDWTSQSWSSYYGILRNDREFYQKAEELELDFQMGVGLVMEAYVFGLITDLWGDAPYTHALNGEEGGEDNLKPAFDSQETIYAGILSSLETANTLLSKSASAYTDINPSQDILYDGDPAKWQKFANSLALRYYMRLSEKDPSTAEAGIKNIVDNPDTYPIITDADDDANVAFPGTDSSNDWPANTVFDGSSGSDYRRKKMCATLVDKLQELNDSRISVWANKIEIPIVVDTTLEDGTDNIVDGVRYIAEDIADNYESTFGYPIDEDPEYVGLPPAWSNVPQAYNLSPDLNQAPNNPHASHINDIYREASGEHLKGRLLTAAEVNFILAEASLRGWISGDAESYYNDGVKASFDAWDLSSDYDTYIAGPAAFDNTIENVLVQKWIASWTSAAESWFDFRRTGYPAIQPGNFVKRDAIPLRFYYSTEEIELNSENAIEAIENLQETTFSDPDGKNSAWSKTWLVQGTNNPY